LQEIPSGDQVMYPERKQNDSWNIVQIGREAQTRIGLENNRRRVIII
jgi:hypothetical protein